MKKKTVKEVKLHKLSVCAYKSQDFAQRQKNFARSHDHATVTFRNSECIVIAIIFINKYIVKFTKISYCELLKIHMVIIWALLEKLCLLFLFFKKR